MLLHASSDTAAQAVARALVAAGIKAGDFIAGSGTYAVWVKVPEQREPEALDLAAKIDPSICKR